MNGLDDLAAVRALLEEAEVPRDDGLEALLGALRATGAAPAPAPSDELAVLMTPIRRRRAWSRRRTGAVVALAVAASLGTGLSAAASPDVREATVRTVDAIARALPHPAAATARPTAVASRSTDAPATVGGAQASERSRAATPGGPSSTAIHAKKPAHSSQSAKHSDAARAPGSQSKEAHGSPATSGHGGTKAHDAVHPTHGAPSPTGSAGSGHRLGKAATEKRASAPTAKPGPAPRRSKASAQ